MQLYVYLVFQKTLNDFNTVFQWVVLVCVGGAGGCFIKHYWFLLNLRTVLNKYYHISLVYLQLRF